MTAKRNDTKGHALDNNAAKPNTNSVAPFVYHNKPYFLKNVEIYYKKTLYFAFRSNSSVNMQHSQRWRCSQKPYFYNGIK